MTMPSTEDGTGNRVELGLPPSGDVSLHRALHLARRTRRERPQGLLVDVCAFRTSDGKRLVLAAAIALVLADRTERPLERRRCKREWREERELVPEERKL